MGRLSRRHTSCLLQQTGKLWLFKNNLATLLLFSFPQLKYAYRHHVCSLSRSTIVVEECHLLLIILFKWNYHCEFMIYPLIIIYNSAMLMWCEEEKCLSLKKPMMIYLLILILINWIHSTTCGKIIVFH